MISLSTILVAHDFSTHSDAALRLAVELARATKARLHLLHCCGIPLGGVLPYDPSIPADVWNSLRDAAVERLEAVRAGVAAQGVLVDAEVSTMFPVEAIRAAAEKLGAGLVVLGTRGLTGLKHVALGSVAERTVRLAPCPVLAVKEGDSGALPRRILVATDFSEPGNHARDVGVALARQLGAEVLLAHAFDAPLVPTTLYGAPIPTDLIAVTRSAARQKLDASVSELRAKGVTVSGHLLEAPAAPALARAAAELGAGLVVVGTHGYTGMRHVLLGSVAERTLRLAPCPVLTVKQEDHQLDD